MRIIVFLLLFTGNQHSSRNSDKPRPLAVTSSTPSTSSYYHAPATSGSQQTTPARHSACARPHNLVLTDSTSTLPGALRRQWNLLTMMQHQKPYRDRERVKISLHTTLWYLCWQNMNITVGRNHLTTVSVVYRYAWTLHRLQIRTIELMGDLVEAQNKTLSTHRCS